MEMTTSTPAIGNEYENECDASTTCSKKRKEATLLPPKAAAADVSRREALLISALLFVTYMSLCKCKR